MSGRRLTFHLIPHTHWDREWYLSRAGFQARLAPAATSLLRFLESDPAARFTLDGQTILLDDIAALQPDLASRLDSAIATGRLAVGPWYLLADEQIPAGESLLHNLLIGRARANQAGQRMDVLYSPDAFGHPSALPMLAREFGIAHAVAWRGIGGSEESGDLYRWQSPSGDELLLYHLPPQGYEIGVDLLDAGSRPAGVWRPIREQLVSRAMSTQIAVLVGADHHAPPEHIGRLRDALQEIEKDHEVVISTMADFFTTLTARASQPILHGELRWSYGYTWTLQGVHASRARMKRRHSLAELRLLRQAEPLTALAALAKVADQRGVLRAGWRTLIECQFHDTIGGCASDLVAEEQSVRLAAVETFVDEMTREALASLSGHDADRARQQPHRAAPTLLLWNAAPRARGGVVTATVTCFRRDVLVGPPSGRVPRSGPGYLPFLLTTASGEMLPVQVLSVEPGLERLDAPRHYPDQDEVDRVRIAFEAPTMQGLEIGVLQLMQGEAEPRPNGIEVSATQLSNQFVVVRVGEDGSLHITDRRTGEEYPGILQFEDQEDQGDCYTVYLPDDSSVSTTTTPDSRQVLSSGPLLGAVNVRWQLKGATGPLTCSLTVELTVDSPMLRCRYEIENHGDHHRLRARLPISEGIEAIAGAAFGFERRPAEAFDVAEYPAERPVLTAPAHRYLAAGSGTRGIAILAPGFFEYEWTPRRDLLLTLFRSVGDLSRGDLPTRPGHAGWPTATPAAQERGTHRIEIAILPAGAEMIDHPGQLEHAWEDAFVPLTPHFIRDFTNRGAPLSCVNITLVGEGLICSAIKPPESGDGIVVRCFNVSDKSVRGAWELSQPVVAARLLRADETVVKSLSIKQPQRIEFVAPPRAMVTVLLVPVQHENPEGSVAQDTIEGYR